MQANSTKTSLKKVLCTLIRNSMKRSRLAQWVGCPPCLYSEETGLEVVSSHWKGRKVQASGYVVTLTSVIALVLLAQGKVLSPFPIAGPARHMQTEALRQVSWSISECPLHHRP
jgi:hypothetical protein